MNSSDTFIKAAIGLLVILGLTFGVLHFLSPRKVSPVLVKQKMQGPKDTTKQVKTLRQVGEQGLTKVNETRDQRALSTPSPAKNSASDTTDAAADSDNLTDDSIPGLSMEQSCAGDWQQAATTELSVFQHQIEQGQFALSQDCAEAMILADIHRRSKWFATYCGRPSPATSATRGNCVSVAPDYRAFAIGQLYRNADQLADVETAALANVLSDGLQNIAKADQSKLTQMVAVADELIIREPELYGAYKAKAFTLLLLEAKHSVPSDADDFENTILAMGEFTTIDPTFALREESLIAEVQDKIGILEDELAEVEQQLEELYSEEETVLGAVTEEELNSRGDDLYQRLEELSSLEATGVLQEDEMVDPDVVKLPFLRLMAQGDYEALIEESENYIQSYPDSPLGYHYAAQGLWRSGDQAGALATIRQAIERDVGNETLLELFKQSADKPIAEILSALQVNLN